tara:strand:+ start:241 stop:582 length:342 start_codon:yes stop_codon:yes gene_type:complete
LALVIFPSYIPSSVFADDLQDAAEAVRNSGVFDQESFEDEAQKTYYNQYLSNLRTELKSLFNIDEDPFKVNKPSGHQTLFACYSELMPSTESPSLSPEDNTPKGIKKQTGAYQ